MALNQKLPDRSANAEADALAALFDDGSLIEIRSGTQPVDADTAPPDGVLLATPSFQNPRFLAASQGVAEANPIVSAAAVASGTATWFRCKDSLGNTLCDGSIGTATSNLIMNTTEVVVDAEVAVSSFFLICSKG